MFDRDYMVEETVQGITLDQIDVVVIDVEGYDFEILKQIDFGRLHPSLVMYERIRISLASRPTGSRSMRTSWTSPKT